jgi:nucleoside triphosphate pyrophosphatase
VILASGSPRRRELLTRLGLEFVAVLSDVDESVRGDEDPVAYVRRLAIEKADAVVTERDDLVIAADTTVDLDGVILGKPVDAAEARRMLTALSGRAHSVHTAVAVRRGSRCAAGVETTTVTMAALSDAMLDWYVGSGEPLDKAGAYAIQEAGAVLVASVAGSVTNVVGLPLTLLDRLLTEVGAPLTTLLR